MAMLNNQMVCWAIQLGTQWFFGETNGALILLVKKYEDKLQKHIR